MANKKKRYSDDELNAAASDEDNQWLHRMTAELILQMRELNRRMQQLREESNING